MACVCFNVYVCVPLAVVSACVLVCEFPWRQCVQHLVQQLQCTVQMHLQPARGVLDALSGVIAAPTFHKAEPHDAQPAQVVHAQTGCTRTCRRTREPWVTVDGVTETLKDRGYSLSAGVTPPALWEPGIKPTTAAACCCICL